jgi:hypothetical protein
MIGARETPLAMMAMTAEHLVIMSSVMSRGTIKLCKTAVCTLLLCSPGLAFIFSAGFCRPRRKLSDDQRSTFVAPRPALLTVLQQTFSHRCWASLYRCVRLIVGNPYQNPRTLFRIAITSLPMEPLL